MNRRPLTQIKLKDLLENLSFSSGSSDNDEPNSNVCDSDSSKPTKLNTAKNDASSSVPFSIQILKDQIRPLTQNRKQRNKSMLRQI